MGLHGGPGEGGGGSRLHARWFFFCFFFNIHAINVKQIFGRTESKGAGAAVLKAPAAFERRGNDSSPSRCVGSGTIMLLINQPTSQ